MSGIIMVSPKYHIGNVLVVFKRCSMQGRNFHDTSRDASAKPTIGVYDTGTKQLIIDQIRIQNDGRIRFGLAYVACSGRGSL